MTLLVLSVTVALGVSFLCSLMEAVLLSLTPAQVAELGRRSPGLGLIWSRFKTDIERPIAVILILNTTAHTIGASVAGAEFDELFGDRWIFVFSLGLTFLMLQFTEILPKTLGVQMNATLAATIARPLQVAVWAMRPLIWLTHYINRPFERGGREGRKSPTLDEITALAGLARLSREIEPQQERIVQGAFRLSKLAVKDLMAPVDGVAFLEAGQTAGAALEAALVDLRTRYPVREAAGSGRVAGYVSFKEVVLAARSGLEGQELSKLLRPVRYVHPDDLAADLLSLFVAQHVHMAVVEGPGGQTLGIVTMEDMVEEIVGELEDEFDRLPQRVQPVGRDAWLVGGGKSMSDLCALLGAGTCDTAESLAAWVQRTLGRAPRPGDACAGMGLRVVVRRTRRGKALEATVRPAEGAEPGHA